MNQIGKYIGMCLLVLCATATGLYGCGKQAGPSQNEETVRPVAITVAKIGTREVVAQLHSNGRMISRNTPTLAAEIDARIVEVLVDVGHEVTLDQPVVKFDSTEFALARREALAETARLQATIANDRRRVSRYRDLRKTNSVPQELLDNAEAALNVSNASLEGAQARLAITDDRLSKCVVRSPLTGTVESRHVSVGDYAKLGEDLLRINDTLHLRARLPFPETVARHLRVGQTAIIESPLAPGQTTAAAVTYLDPDVGPGNRAVIATVDLTNPGYWRPNATVVGRVIIERRPQAVVVPAMAVVTRPAGQVVYVLADANVIQRQVVLGERGDDWVEITSGLKAGEVIAIEGAHYLSDGVAVIITGDGA